MMNKGVAILLFLFVGFSTKAQVDIQLNTYAQNPYYITPAYINDVQSVVFTFSGRNQWAGLNGAPQTYFGSVSSFWEDINTQIGIRIFNDKTGYISVTDASLTYAYNLRLSDGWWSNLGLALAYQSLDYDLSKITFEGEDEAAIYDRLTSKKKFNGDVGVEIYNPNWRFGLAGKNLISLFSSKTPIHQNINYLYGLYKQTSQNPISFGGGVFGIQYGNRYQVELNATAYFKLDRENELFRTSLIYRTPKEIGVVVGINIAPSLYVSYGYDYNFGISSHRLGHTHELMLVYKLDPKPVLRWDVLE